MTGRSFFTDGFALIPDVLAPEDCDILSLLLHSREHPGSRGLLLQDWCVALASRIRSHPGVASVLPAGHVAVQCTCFIKSVSTNWLVPVHQDLSIPVAERIAHPELSGWSEKESAWYVQPPVEVLQQLVAIRLHIDGCADEDGPLHVVPGTHELGRIGADQAAGVRAGSREVVCTASRGSVLAMRPLLLHSSSKAKGTSMRRILHFLFGPSVLPHGLRWEHAI